MKTTIVHWGSLMSFSHLISGDFPKWWEDVRVHSLNKVRNPISSTPPAHAPWCTLPLQPSSTSAPQTNFSAAAACSFKPPHSSGSRPPPPHTPSPHSVFWTSTSCLPLCVQDAANELLFPGRGRGGETRVAQNERSLSGRVLGSSVCGAHYPPLIKGMASPRHMFRLGEPALTLKKLFAFCFVNCLCF